MVPLNFDSAASGDIANAGSRDISVNVASNVLDDIRRSFKILSSILLTGEVTSSTGLLFGGCLTQDWVDPPKVLSGQNHWRVAWALAEAARSEVTKARESFILSVRI